MDRGQFIKELEEIKNHNPSGDPTHLQMKALEVKNVEALIELIQTLDRIDESNKKLELSNIKLAKQNLRIQILIMLLAAGALYVALFVHR